LDVRGRQQRWPLASSVILSLLRLCISETRLFVQDFLSFDDIIVEVSIHRTTA
jgi:hypothetical protein